MREYKLKPWQESAPPGFFCCGYDGEPIKPHSFPKGKFLTNDVEWVAHLCGGIADKVSGADTSTKLVYGDTEIIDCRSLGASVDSPDAVAAAYDSLCHAFGKSRFRGTLSATVAQFLPRNPFAEQSNELATEIRFGAYHGGIQLNNSQPKTFIHMLERDRTLQLRRRPKLTGVLPYSVSGPVPAFPNTKAVGSLFMFDINAAWPTALRTHCYRFTNMRCDDVGECGIYFVEVRQDGNALPLVPHKNNGRAEWGSVTIGQIWADSELIAHLQDNGAEVSVIYGYASMPDESGDTACAAVECIPNAQTRKDALRALCGRVAMRPHTSGWQRDDGTNSGRIIAGWLNKNWGTPGPFPRQADPTWSAYMCSVTNRKVANAARRAICAGYSVIFCDTDCLTVCHRDCKTVEQAAADLCLDYGTNPGQFSTRIVNTSMVYWGPKGYLSNQRSAESITPAWVAMLDKEYYGFA